MAVQVKAEVALVYDPDAAFALEVVNGIHNTLFCRNPSGYWSEVCELLERGGQSK